MTHRQLWMATLLLALVFGVLVGALTMLSVHYAPLPELPTLESMLNWRCSLMAWLAGRG